MKRLLLMSVVLASCAPVLQTVQGTQVSCTVQPGAVVFHNPGPQTAEAVNVALLGPSLVTGADGEQVSRGWRCSIGDVAGGKDVALGVTGSVNSWSVTYDPPGSNRPVYL